MTRPVYCHYIVVWRGEGGGGGVGSRFGEVQDFSLLPILQASKAADLPLDSSGISLSKELALSNHPGQQQQNVCQ